MDACVEAALCLDYSVLAAVCRAVLGSAQEQKLCVCCRYLAVRARVPVKHAALPQAGHATSRSAPERSCVQPASLMQHPLYVTPNSKRNMMLAGRGRRAAEQGGTVWQSKVRLCPDSGYMPPAGKSAMHSCGQDDAYVVSLRTA